MDLFFYASSEGEGDGGNTAIMRAKLNANTLIEKQVLYKANPNTTKGQHFGSRIEFDNDGFLYFSIGERGERDINPQDITAIVVKFTDFTMMAEFLKTIHLLIHQTQKKQFIVMAIEIRKA